MQDLTGSLGDLSLKDQSKQVAATNRTSDVESRIVEDTPVSRAIAELAALTEAEVRDQSAYLTAVGELKAEWTPRYNLATDDYTKLTFRIQTVKDTAVRYFDLQRELTSQINDRNLRTAAAKNDANELRQYELWREASDKLLERLDGIVKDLNDMNIVIDKLHLSANFSLIYDGFETLTISIIQLHDDLEVFWEKSEQITTTFGN